MFKELCGSNFIQALAKGLNSNNGLDGLGGFNQINRICRDWSKNILKIFLGEEKILSIWGPISASFISFSSLMKQSGNSTSSVNEIQSICYLINSLIGILAPMPELITFQLQLF